MGSSSFCLCFQGASLGCLLGTVFALWIGFGSYAIDRHISKLPTSIANCTTLDLNTTVLMTTDNYSNLTASSDPLHHDENL